MKIAKLMKSFRLSEITTKELSQLANKYNISQADIISVLVHCAYMGWSLKEFEKYCEIAQV